MNKLEQITARLQAEARDPLWLLRFSEELEEEKKARARQERVDKRNATKTIEAVFRWTVLDTVHALGQKLYERWPDWCEGKRAFAGGIGTVSKRRREGIELHKLGCTVQLLRYRGKDLCDVRLPDGVWLGSYHLDEGCMQLAIRDAMWRVVDYLKDPCDKKFWRCEADNG